MRSYKKRRAAMRSPFYCSISDQEIQHVPASGRLGFIQLRIAAVTAGNCDKLLILHVKQLGKVPARRLKLIAFILGTTTFWAHILLFFQGKSTPFHEIILSQISDKQNSFFLQISYAKALFSPFFRVFLKNLSFLDIPNRYFMNSLKNTKSFY